MSGAILQRMVQNKIKPGRPLAFEREAALSAAMNLFWDRGYDDVALSDLEAHTGLNRSSLYNSFGSKDALFEMALRHYTTIADGMLSALELGSGGLSDLVAFFENLEKHLADHAGKGCFVVNTMVAPHRASRETAAVTKAYIARFLRAAHAVLARAAARHEIPAAKIEDGAHLLLSVVLAANLLARARQPRELVKSVLAAGLTQIRDGGKSAGCSPAGAG